MMKDIKITLHEYSYSCSDKCCLDYGIITTVNGKELECHNTDTETILKEVLTHLGYNVEIETTYNND